MEQPGCGTIGSGGDCGVRSIDVDMLGIEALLAIINYTRGTYPLHPFFLRTSVPQWLEPGLQLSLYQNSNPSSTTQTTLANY